VVIGHAALLVEKPAARADYQLQRQLDVVPIGEDERVDEDVLIASRLLDVSNPEIGDPLEPPA